MQTTTVVPADVEAFGRAHSDVADQLESACSAADPAAAEMPAAYGAVGSVFTDAVAQFNSSLKASGHQLADQYRALAGALDATGKNYTTMDHNNAAAVKTAAATNGTGNTPTGPDDRIVGDPPDGRTPTVQAAGFDRGGPPLDTPPAQPGQPPPTPTGSQPFLPAYEQSLGAPPAPQAPAATPTPGQPAPQPFLPAWQQAISTPPAPTKPPAVPMPSGGTPPVPPTPKPFGDCFHDHMVPDLGEHMVSDGFSNGMAGMLAGATGGAVVTPEVGGAGGIPGAVLGFVGGFAKGAFEAPLKAAGKGLADCTIDAAEQAGQ